MDATGASSDRRRQAPSSSCGGHRRSSDVDAIVNAARTTTLLGGGGVDGAIHQRGRAPAILECRRLGGCETGDAAKLTGAGSLPARHVIHAVGPVYGGDTGRTGEEPKAPLASAYRRSARARGDGRGAAARSRVPVDLGRRVSPPPIRDAAAIATRGDDDVEFLAGGVAHGLEGVRFDPLQRRRTSPKVYTATTCWGRCDGVRGCGRRPRAVATQTEGGVGDCLHGRRRHERRVLHMPKDDRRLVVARGEPRRRCRSVGARKRFPATSWLISRVAAACQHRLHAGEGRRRGGRAHGRRRLRAGILDRRRHARRLRLLGADGRQGPAASTADRDGRPPAGRVLRRATTPIARRGTLRPDALRRSVVGNATYIKR